MNTYQLIGLIFAAVGVLTLAVMGVEASRRKTLNIDFLPLSSWLTGISRVMIGVLFIYSGFVKANDYVGFAYKLEEYFLVFGEQFPFMKGFWNFFIPLAEPLAWFISVFEIALAVALIVGWRMNLTIWLTLLMMVFFTVLTGYSHFTGSVTDCGCFGEALKLEPWESFVKDIILTGMLIPLFLVRKSVRAVPSPKIAGWLTLASFVVAGVFSWACHENLPLIDYRPYKVGVDLAACTTVPGPEGYPKCKDWDPAFEGEEIALFEGNTLMIITYQVQNAPAKAADKSGNLARELKSSSVKVVGATSSGRTQLASFKQAHNVDYPFCFLDETVLKTIVRSHPGYMLLKDGVVVKKWHYNFAPDAAEIKSLLGI